VKTETKILLAILALGAYLRLANLGLAPFWIDEVGFISMMNQGARQEWLPRLVCSFLPVGEFWTRLPFALSGIGTIAVIYHVAIDKRMGLALAFVFAVFPLFVFWDRMARPYAMAGLFMSLGWLSAWGYVLALLCTPISILGLNLLEIRKRWKLYVVLLLVAVGLYLLRSDHAREHWRVIFDSSRWWYIPSVAGLLYLARIVGASPKSSHPKRKSGKDIRTRGHVL